MFCERSGGVNILVISDTHRNIAPAMQLIETKSPDYVIHLGDVAADCDLLQRMYPKQKLIAVLGNNDFRCSPDTYPLERVAELGGKRFFLCHGHTVQVKYTLSTLLTKGRGANADMVLYGHTHQPYLANESGMMVMNPGSTSTYGWITIENDNINARVLPVVWEG